METVDVQHKPGEDTMLPPDFEDLQEAGVDVAVGDDFVEIRLEASNTSFIAWVDSDRIAYLLIRTVQSDGTRHPYFGRHRASEIAQGAISYFDQLERVKGLGFQWGRPATGQHVDRSDNYTSYLSTRNALAASMDYENAKRQAALQTWTLQQVALPLGFTEITSVDETGDLTAPGTVTGIAHRADTPDQTFSPPS